ncbi:helix-turn-helix transcriptional regulator [bacterium]|nr:helix-turn-helix transcriptional regulator [bacterium]
MIDKKQLGQKIKEIRKRKKVTQEKLAEVIDVDFGYISKLEVGQNYPSIQTLDKIADALGVNISEFFININESEIDSEKEILNILKTLSDKEKHLLYKIAKSIY